MTDLYNDRWGHAFAYDPSKPLLKKTGAFAVMLNAGRVLVMRAPLVPDTCDLPGGRMDPGETQDQTLVREVMEETGFDIGAPRIVKSFSCLHRFHTNCRTEFWDYTQHFHLLDISHRPDMVFDGQRKVTTGLPDAGITEWIALDSVVSSGLRFDHRPALAALLSC